MQKFFSLSRKQRRALERQLGPEALEMLDGSSPFGAANTEVESPEIESFNRSVLNLYMFLLKATKTTDESGKVVCGDPQLNASFVKFRKEIENPLASGPIKTFSSQQSTRLTMLIMKNEHGLVQIDDTDILEAEFGLKRNWGNLDALQKEEIWTMMRGMCRNVIMYSFDLLTPLKKHLPSDIQKTIDKLISCVRDKIQSCFEDANHFSQIKKEITIDVPTPRGHKFLTIFL